MSIGDSSPPLKSSASSEPAVVSFYPQRKAESMSPLVEVSNTLTNGTNPGFQNAICYKETPAICQYGDAAGNEVICLNDQGGSVMRVEKDGCAGTLRANTHGNEQLVCYENHAQDSRVREIAVAPVLSAKAGMGGNNLPLVCGTMAVAENIIGRKVENGGNGPGVGTDLSYTLNATGVHGVMHGAVIRRLMPVECERLMGFPDGWTQIPWNGKPVESCPDAPRYKACGNSFPVNVIRWIGRRIQQIESENKENKGKQK